MIDVKRLEAVLDRLEAENPHRPDAGLWTLGHSTGVLWAIEMVRQEVIDVADELEPVA